jgi:REP element-mobilizing transposase RayT
MAGKHLSLLVHFVWSTSGREPWIKKTWREPMHEYIGGIMKKKRAKVLASGGTDDHIHLYASLPSTISIADFVNAVKSNSSRWVHESYPNTRAFAWQDGYGAFSVSKSQEKRLIKYINEQETHHRKHDFKKEFITLLKRNEIEYDPRYLWD